MRNSNNEAVSILDQFEGLKAIHFVGEVGSGRAPDSRVYEGEANQQNQDGVFRQGPLNIWTEDPTILHPFPFIDRDVTAEATCATTVAPKFQPGSAPTSKRSHQNISCGYISE